MQPRKIGRYEIKDELGAGGMGQVYRAFDPQSNRDVALKVINLNALRRFAAERREEVLKRFSHEVKVIAQLQHPAIVPLFDAGDDNGTPYMVMPLMAGDSLEKRLRDQSGQPQPLPFAEIERILTWITPALDKMHAQKVVHRDLKPDNILFDEDNHPYIADFGIAKLTEGSITFNTGVIGTPAYMSPEQADGQKPIDARSDVYSLGAVLYKMLTGERPYHKAHPAILPIYHIQEPPPRLDELRTDLSADWQAIIDRAMAKKPEKRYQTAGELSTAVSQLLRNEAEREARERKAREEAKRQAELARLRREAEVAREQAKVAREQALGEKQQRKAALRKAETARQEALGEKQQRKAALQQAENKQRYPLAPLPPPRYPLAPLPPPRRPQREVRRLPLLSAINPLDHLRLLWWTLIIPKQLKCYQEQHGKAAERPAGTWLTSTLTWSPLLLPTLALGLETLPNGPVGLSAATYLWMSGGLAITCLLTGWFGKRDDRLLGFVAFEGLAIVSFVVAFGVALIVVLEVAGGVAFVMAREVALALAGVLAVIVAGVVARVVARVVVFWVASGVVLGVVLVLGITSSLALGVRDWAGGIVAIVTGVVAFGVVFGLADVIEKSIKSGVPSWLARGMFGALVAAYAFLLWYCFFGGWKVFA